MQKLSGILMVIGVVLFFAAESMIVSTFGFSDPQLIAGHPFLWGLTMLMSGGGTILIVIGLALLLMQARRLTEDSLAKTGSYVGLGLAGLGALAWAISSFSHIILTPEALQSSSMTFILSIAYYLLTQAGVAITGFVLLRSGYPKWLAFVVLAAGVLLFVGWIVMQGGPPAFNNFIFLFLGIALLILRSRSTDRIPQTA